MVDPRDLLRRASASDDGEAYVTVARGAGVRLGAGARATPSRAPGVFVEVILDPFPDRPRVTSGRLIQQAQVLDRLNERGYVVSCDPDGTIACECRVPPERLDEELRIVRRILSLHPARVRHA